MSWLAGPYLVAAALLVVAGLPKIFRPDSAVRALASLKLPAHRGLVRVLGAAEAAIGAGAAGAGGRIAAVLVALSYAAFSVFVALALARGGVLASCGCFGTADTPPTRLHLAVTSVLAGVALAVAAGPARSIVDVVGDSPLAGLPFLAMTTLSVWFTYLLLAVLPRSTAAAIARAAVPTHT